MPAIVQQATATFLDTDPVKSVTLASPVAVGVTLILGLTERNWGFPASDAVTDTLGNTWDRVMAHGNNGQGGAVFYRCAATLAGTPTVTFAHTGSRYVSLWLMELDQECPVSLRWSNETAATTVTVGLAPTAYDDSLVLGCLSNEGVTAASLAAGTGWTTDASIDLPNTTTTTLLGISKAVPTAGAADPTWTQTANSVVVVGISLAPATEILPNLTEYGAHDIGTVPTSFTWDVGLADQPAQEVWFKFTWTQPAFNLISYFGLDPGTGALQYGSRWTVYVGSPGALAVYLEQEDWSAAVTSPLVDAYTTYYFKVENALGARSLNGELLLAQFVFSNIAAAPQGAILINDDSAAGAFPYVIMNPANGDVYQSVPFPKGEAVGVLTDGSTMWNHIDVPGVLSLYDPELTLITQPTWIGLGVAGITNCPLTSDFAGNYYACEPGDADLARNATVQVITSAGVAGATWGLPTDSISATGVSRDNTVFYYASVTASPPSKVMRWDLVNDLPLSDLYAGDASYRAPLDILVMDDDTILLRMRGVINNTNPSNVLRYSAAGALLDTYPITKWLNRLTYAIDPDEFWAWEYLTEAFGGSPSTARFSRIAMSTGTVVETFTVAHSLAGMCLNQIGGPGPIQFPNYSCPFVVVRHPPGIPHRDPDIPDIPVPPEPPVGYDTVTVPQRRLRRAPHLTDEQRWLFYDRFQLDMETGVGLSSGQGSDPQVMVRWSNDGGHTWSREHWVSAGRMGDYTASVAVRRTGRARTRTFEVVVSDPVRWHLIQAFLDVTPGNGT